jgi:hypothetical protein
MNAFEALGLNEQLVQAVADLKPPQKYNKKPSRFYYPALQILLAWRKQVPEKRLLLDYPFYN